MIVVMFVVVVFGMVDWCIGCGGDDGGCGDGVHGGGIPKPEVGIR